MKYDYKAIEKKWQDIWDAENTFAAKQDFSLPKYYALVEFPYPSGQGKAFRSMGGTTAEAVRHLYVPAALPALFTSLKVASGTAVAVLFLAESFATTSGLGYLIMDAWGMGDVLFMFNAILGMSLLGLVIYGVIGLLERVCCPWLFAGRK